MTTVTEIRLPQFGMGMQEGTIITWFKREGDRVAAGEVVAEIEAEKVTEELFAPDDGVLQQILVPEGETAAVNELLAVIAPGAAEPDTGESKRDAGEAKQDAVERRRGAVAAPDPVADRPAPTPALAADGSRRQVTPRARRLAADLGVDLDSVVGTGPDGRVTEDDITAAAATIRSGR